jgi:hypothetical protein
MDADADGLVAERRPVYVSHSLRGFSVAIAAIALVVFLSQALDARGVKLATPPGGRLTVADYLLGLFFATGLFLGALLLAATWCVAWRSARALYSAFALALAFGFLGIFLGIGALM